MTQEKPEAAEAKKNVAPEPELAKKKSPAVLIEQEPGEVGGQDGPEPTRYGDWERNGRVSDF